MEIAPGDIIVCTVEKIIGTTVFVEINGSNEKGTIILSEIAAGRIRNLRDYVVPKKVIICKVLRVLPDHIELSLRRVKEKEKKEALEKSKLEKSYKQIFGSVMGEKTSEIIKEIEREMPLSEFLEEAKKDSSGLKKLIGKENAEKILEMLKKQKEKVFSVKKEIKLISNDSDGIIKIKELLSGEKKVEVKYLAAGRYLLSSEDKSPKKADQKATSFLEEIEKTVKEKNIEISY